MRIGWAVHPSETARANTQNRIRSGLSTGTERVRFWPLVDPARRGFVRELLDGGHDTAPGSPPSSSAGERQLVSASRALHKCIIAITLEHERRRARQMSISGIKAGGS